MGPEIIRLGMRLQAISFDPSVRILHHLLLHTFPALMRFVHALVPLVFPRQVGTMIQESPSQFFPTALGIAGCVTRRTTRIGMASWKLVLVRAGLAPERLLETYDEERHAAALENLRLTSSTMRFLVPSRGLENWKRDAILRLSVFFPFMRQYVNAGYMSNPFTYRDSAIISEDVQPQLNVQGTATPEQRALLKRFQRGPVAGALAPEVALVDGTTGEPVFTVDLFWRNFVVFYFCADPDRGIDALQRVRSALLQVPTTLCVISPHVPVKAPPEGIRLLLDREGKGATAYNAGPRTLYLVRPDKHIAVRRFTSDLSELPTLLECAIGDGASQGREQAAPGRSKMDSVAAGKKVKSQ